MGLIQSDVKSNSEEHSLRQPGGIMSQARMFDTADKPLRVFMQIHKTHCGNKNIYTYTAKIKVKQGSLVVVSDKYQAHKPRIVCNQLARSYRELNAMAGELSKIRLTLNYNHASVVRKRNLPEMKLADATNQVAIFFKFISGENYQSKLKPKDLEKSYKNLEKS